MGEFYTDESVTLKMYLSDGERTVLSHYGWRKYTQKAKAVLKASGLLEENDKLRVALREHHDWQLAQGVVTYWDGYEGKSYQIDATEAYAESLLCERTLAALHEA